MEKGLLFSVDTYPGPENFCDRKSELKRLTEMYEHKRNGVIYSYRRMGKTGLIQHFHNKLSKKRKVITIYVDVMDTDSDAAFINKLITACLEALERKKKGFLQRTIAAFTRLRPVITIDPITQLPSVQLDIGTANDVRPSLNALMQLLSEQPYTFQIAIDEFQQISNYAEPTVIDATLRSHLPKVNNVHYIFSGSERHLLLELFSDPKKPLYASMELLHLDYIDSDVYGAFIVEQFKKAKIKITADAVEEILKWTNGHTFYTQYVCNKLLSKSYKRIDIYALEKVKEEILFQYEVVYVNFKKLLSKNQWQLLVAIAKEGSVTEYTSKDFLSKYRLSQSSTKQALEALISKSMIIEHLTKNKSVYQVYDVFLWRWAEQYG